jgi:dihydrofolate reductase
MAGVTAEISMSLDGYIAGPDQTLEQPLGAGGEQLHEWAFALRTFRQAHGMEGGEAGPDDEIMAESIGSAGAVVMGRRMFSGGAGPWEDDPNADGWWGDEPPFGVPVFVVTHHRREALTLGATTFHFVTGGVESAVEQARTAAADRRVGVGGGAEVIGQALDAGLVDELVIHLVPVVLGGGVGLFDGVAPRRLERARAEESPTGVVHLWYQPR